MSREQTQIDNSPKTIATRWMNEVWNDRNEETIDALLPADSRGHIEGGETVGPEGFRAMRAGLLGAFPDLVVSIDDVIEEGEQVVVRWSFTGTHLGDQLGMPPTGRKVVIRGMTWMIVRKGLIVEGWDSWNQGGLLATLQEGSTTL
jgi:steroid delta-isomerase-like uncharacterized protein